MDAVKFLKELKRMCENTGDCDDCPAHFRKSGFFACKLEHIPESYEDFAFDDLVSFVEKWSAEHPVKTRLQDFLEKCPDAPLTEDGLPFLFPLVFGYCNEIIDPKEADCRHCKNRFEGLNFCWNLSVEE